MQHCGTVLCRTCNADLEQTGAKLLRGVFSGYSASSQGYCAIPGAVDAQTSPPQFLPSRALLCAVVRTDTCAGRRSQSQSRIYLYLCMPCQHAGSAPSRAVPRPRTPRVHGLATTTLSQYSASGTLIFTRPLPRNETIQHASQLRHTSHGYDMLHGSAAARLWPGCDSAAAG